MTTAEAAAWYEDAICTYNRFGPARVELYRLAEQGSDAVSLVQNLAVGFETDARKAAEMLRNPPAPWPKDVAALVAERADLLDESAGRNIGLLQINTADEYLVWHQEMVSFLNPTNEIGESIQSSLGIREVECPPSSDEDVAAALLELRQAAEVPADSGLRLVIDCYGLEDEDREFATLAKVFDAVANGWKPDFCSTAVEEFSIDFLDENQIEAIELYGSRFVDGPPDIEDSFTMLIDNCAQNPEEGYGDMIGAKATLLMCPESPFASQIEEFAKGNTVVGDGTHVVGKDISAGTFVTTSSVSDCYWERVTENGKTIANDFIKSAPEGAKVTVKSSDGALVTENCYSWKKTS